MKLTHYFLTSMLFLIGLFFLPSVVHSQDKKPKKISLMDHLLTEDLPTLTIQTNVNKVFADYKIQNYYWGNATLSFDGEEQIQEEIQVKTRGKFRSRYCENPPIKIKFSNKSLKAQNFKKLNEFKIVYPCKSKEEHQNYVYKEYLIYKLYNVLTENSLRAQLVDITLVDSAATIADRNFKGFLIEDREELVKRMKGVTDGLECMPPDNLSQYDYTLFQVFQYFIGNTDWLLPTCKNAEIILLKDGKMIPIPYDFDFAGMVNTNYASPDLGLGVTSVTQRLFLGHLKTMEELNPVLTLFQAKKSALIQVINDFEYLPAKDRKKMIKYLESFYKIIKKSKNVTKVFVHPIAEKG